MDLTVAGYMKELSEHRIAASRCNDCDALYLPPRPICPNCQTRKMSVESLSGEGTVAGLTSISIVPSAMAAKGYGRKNPYVTGVVALKEGPSLTARIELPDDGGEIQSRVGMPVTASFEAEVDGDETRVTLVFQPS